MFKTTSELLDFIEAAKEAKIKAFKIGEIEVQFSDLAFVDAIMAAGEQPSSEERNTSKTLTDTAPDESDDELLFWSAKG